MECYREFLHIKNNRVENAKEKGPNRIKVLHSSQQSSLSSHSTVDAAGILKKKNMKLRSHLTQHTK